MSTPAELPFSALWETSARAYDHPTVLRSDLEILILRAGGMSDDAIAALPPATVSHTLTSLCAAAFGMAEDDA